MAFESRDSKYASEILHSQQHHPRGLDPVAYNPYNSLHHSPTDENRNENNCNNNKETLGRGTTTTTQQQSLGTQTIEKVDAATMTDPLRIDFRLTSEYLARCNANNSTSQLLSPMPISSGKYEENSSSEASSNNCHDIKPKIHYDIEPTRHVDGILMYHCPECAYRFEDREMLHEHLEDHRQRPHICDICGASLKRKEHLDRHKQGHNKDRPYQCSMCCKSFKRNEHLARHMIIHSGSKNQICPECGKAFYRKDHLKKHLQSHNSGNRGGNKTINCQNSQAVGQQDDEVFGSFAMMMRQAGPPPFSTIRT